MSQLINCPSCGHQVSKEAQACPSCGHKLNSSFIEKAIEVAIYGIAAYAIFAIFILSSQGVYDFFIDTLITGGFLLSGLVVIGAIWGIASSFIANPPKFIRKRRKNK